MFDNFKFMHTISQMKMRYIIDIINIYLIHIKRVIYYVIILNIFIHLCTVNSIIKLY